ncbi:MAG: hypothetical protein J6A35_06130 [Paludibacteraceae bacterium]|nr:hypothetical protein [Paludibacteraceae bacterium]
MDIHTIEISTQIDTIGQFWERISDALFVSFIEETIAVLVFVARITRVYADGLGGVGIELCECLFVGLVDTFVLISSE